jgi:hypothetical protein
VRVGRNGIVIGGTGSDDIPDYDADYEYWKKHERVQKQTQKENNNVRETDYGTTPVSPQKRYTGVSAPGVWRPLSGGNPQGGDSTGIDSSPLENYVKMLVTSQLAAQGVPTNEPFQGQESNSVQAEPFQVNETSAIGNASDYIHKGFKKIFG